ncbi:MAG TPA: sialidase family protein [Xanthobacteraceae bacterium]|jgi:photosystem II stability/assembly factor-like uncharacterized protein|nr:sialidase family protein [Xanthobacteraceae bacterium]
MILLSNGGTNTQRSRAASNTMIIGTVDGVVMLERVAHGWIVKHRALGGCFVSAVTASEDGTLFAATHGFGAARSDDGGLTWTWILDGLDHMDLWSARAGKLQGRNLVGVGALPAHLYISENGKTWRDLPALRDAPSVGKWCFPPPPRIGHVKDIVFDGDRLLVGIEIGALLVSKDFGESFTELHVDPDPVECDIHRVLVHPDRPRRLIVANGIVGVMSSDDDGATWRKNPMPPHADYPDAIVVHPDAPDTVFLTAGVGWPSQWYAIGKARGKIARSRDGGNTWRRLLGGLPNGQRALFSALTIEAWPGGCALYAVDTDGEVFESTDEGDTWTNVAEVPPVSKGEFYRALARDRGKLAVDDIVVSNSATERLAKVAARR